jgi:hypothetical protein
VTEVLRSRSTLLILPLGIIGAALALSFLILIPTGEASTAYARLIAEPLPNVIFVAAAGFGLGVLVALVWSLTWWLLASHAPQA